MSENIECKVCGSESLGVFMDFGKMPVTNSYPTKEVIEKGEEYMWNMAVGFCEDCKMVQLTEFVPYDKYIVPDEQGKTEYAFHSSLSKVMTQHFERFAEEVEERFLSSGQRVADIGGNDGIMLKAFSYDVLPLNIEPSSNVAEESRKKGIETVEEFFSPGLARRLVKEKGRFGAVTSSNVILNIHNLNGVASGVEIMLDKEGVFVMQDPYIGQIIGDTAYDQIYDEHAWFFSLISVNNLFNRYGMEVFDSELQPVHGGSMRMFIARQGDYQRTERCQGQMDAEIIQGWNTSKPYTEFAKRAEEKRDKLKGLLGKLKSDGKRIVGYAAASKGTVILNYAGIGPETVDYVSDSTPDKQGKYVPGVHIPIVSPKHFRKDNPDFALLGARNHAKEIIGKELGFINRGGKFIVPLPEPRILE